MTCIFLIVTICLSQWVIAHVNHVNQSWHTCEHIYHSSLSTDTRFGNKETHELLCSENHRKTTNHNPYYFTQLFFNTIFPEIAEGCSIYVKVRERFYKRSTSSRGAKNVKFERYRHRSSKAPQTPRKRGEWKQWLETQCC